MKNKISSILAISTLVLVSSSCSKKTTASSTPPPSAESQQQKSSSGPSFDALLAKMDTNKDGKLSLAEVQGPLKDDFPTIDTNKDGLITKEEFANAPRMQGRK